MITATRYETDTSSGMFANLSAEDIEFISSHGAARSYPKNTNVITEGDSSTSLYVIIVGQVKVYLSDEDGGEVILGYQGPGEYFGELALIDDAPRSASVKTTQSSRLVYLSQPAFEECLQENPELARKMYRSTARRMRSLTEFAKSLALNDVYGRLRDKLYDLAVEKDGVQVIEQRLTHQEMANMVGSGREMISRIMSSLRVGGYIEVDKSKKITLLKELPLHY
ncbi:MAG: Crp/Fnr family transcriptional regulator [Gammaproteobacteria bacterium]